MNTCAHFKYYFWRKGRLPATPVPTAAPSPAPRRRWRRPPRRCSGTRWSTDGSGGFPSFRSSRPCNPARAPPDRTCRDRRSPARGAPSRATERSGGMVIRRPRRREREQVRKTGESLYRVADLDVSRFLGSILRLRLWIGILYQILALLEKDCATSV